MNELSPREALLTLLDQVDYTRNNCSPTEMVGAVLDKSVIDTCRAVIEKSRAHPSANADAGGAHVRALVKRLRDGIPCVEATRCSHQCAICLETIPAGSRVRAKREINNEYRKAMTFYFCELCCAAMARSWKDEGRSIEHRTSIGMKLAAAPPPPEGEG